MELPKLKGRVAEHEPGVVDAVRDLGNGVTPARARMNMGFE